MQQHKTMHIKYSNVTLGANNHQKTMMYLCSDCDDWCFKNSGSKYCNMSVADHNMFTDKKLKLYVKRGQTKCNLLQQQSHLQQNEVVSELFSHLPLCTFLYNNRKR